MPDEKPEASAPEAPVTTAAPAQTPAPPPATGKEPEVQSGKVRKVPAAATARERIRKSDGSAAANGDIPCYVDAEGLLHIDNAKLLFDITNAKLANPLNDAEFAFYLLQCTTWNVNPLLGQIWPVKTDDGRFYVAIYYRVWIERARKTGLLSWWKYDEIYDDPVKMSGFKAIKVTIQRKDSPEPFVHICHLVEFDLHQANWKTKPRFMLMKTAVGQALGLCFYGELGSGGQVVADGEAEYIQEAARIERERREAPSPNGSAIQSDRQAAKGAALPAPDPETKVPVQQAPAEPVKVELPPEPPKPQTNLRVEEFSL